MDPINAALVNCLSSAVHAFDDTHLRTITHPTGPVAAACLSVAQRRKVTGDEFYAALVLGMEIECRLSEALLSSDNGASVGWYITGVTGGIGAAAAASRLLGLEAPAIASAIGIAAAQAGGFRATHGSMAMPMIPGFAARNGLSAALWAQAGMVCMPNAIEGANGLFDVLAPKADRLAASRDLGARYTMLENAYKPYPCGIVVHPVIDACLELRAAHTIDCEAIAHVDCSVHPVGKHLGDRKHPRTEFDAQVSMAYLTAVTLLTGKMTLEHLTPAWLANAAASQLQDRVSVTADPTLARDQAVVVIAMKDGAKFEAKVEHARGSMDRPLTRDELVAKFTAQTAPVTGAKIAAEFVTLLSGAETLDLPALLQLVETHPASA
jgi:2-methylcitrate dehydratase PrpD